jgi:hypothetical protein
LIQSGTKIVEYCPFNINGGGIRGSAMGQATNDRRRQQRCVKDVGMHCSYLHGNMDQLVRLRNFSYQGIYFESAWNIVPGTLIVLRSMDINDSAVIASYEDVPQYSFTDFDPDVCLGYRSHSVAKVRRCVKLDGYDDPPLYGIGAEIQILTD